MSRQDDPAGEADPRCHRCRRKMSGPVITLSANRGGDRWPSELELCGFKCLKAWVNDPEPTQTGWDQLER